MPDIPKPTEGGSYLFDPKTGALQLLERGGDGAEVPTDPVADAPQSSPPLDAAITRADEAPSDEIASSRKNRKES